MKILFSGGGTLGPVTPLLAIKDVVLEKDAESSFVWIGTSGGPERQLIEEHRLPFYPITAGKFRRYFSFLNIFDVVRVVVGFFQSIRILLKENPDICITAGGFVSVPVHSAAWLLGIPTWVHQQDVEVGLANKLMTPLAKMITTSLEGITKEFPAKKTVWLGNPVRKEIFEGNRAHARKMFNLTSRLPVVLVLGGGTGSLKVNQLIAEATPHLGSHAEIIHLSGKERPQESVVKTAELFPNYRVYQFLGREMKDAYAVADIIVCRGGFGTLTEAAALGKPCIIIPKPGHQVENVRFLERAGAAVLVNELTADGLFLAKKIREILGNPDYAKSLATSMHHTLKTAESKDILEIYNRVLGIAP
ncbi:MAG TPA: UDP-N-acetylglucosamine--N-acetylmuramyl-(pentapeptide) pyrophosphoryl-undecaprenol N-acetylglucosamine transferase [Candidatus Magasanikbacteria bacterium]|nr:UDP-N-acetylglucosamine--N-acetylmuramyl-(pentapeptide) pyrophosphoryl-undecaprenol N-acetylglucosamine transferase [Candidatus Magasanikbacteria bacterium]